MPNQEDDIIKPADAGPGDPDWYNSNWLYRKKIYIDSSYNLEDYQVKIIVGYTVQGDVGCNRNCREDFGDIRFTQSNGLTLISYWQQPYHIGSTSVFWVKVPSISVESSTYIYMYYGNSEASSVSNGTNTFMDDFDNSENGFIDFENYEEGALSGQHGWQTYAFSGVIDIEDNEDYGKLVRAVRTTGIFGASFVIIASTFDNDGKAYSDIAIQVWTKPLYSSSIRQYHVNNDTNENANRRFTVGNRGGSYWQWWDGSWKTSDALIKHNQWQKIEYCYNGTNLKVFVDDYKIYEGTRHLGAAAPAGFEASDTSNTTHQYWDNIAVRKYVEPEPTPREDKPPIRISKYRMDMGNKPIKSLQAPSIGQDIATKTYTDDTDTKGVIRGINEQAGVSYQLVLEDRGKYIRLTNADSITLTVPNNSAVEFPIGVKIVIVQGNTGQVTVAGASGVDIFSHNSADKTTGQYAKAILIKTNTNEWFLGGSIES